MKIVQLSWQNNNCQKELSATKRFFFISLIPNVIEAMSWLIDECFLICETYYIQQKKKKKKKKKKGRRFAIFATLLWICSHIQTFSAHSIPRKLDTWLSIPKTNRPNYLVLP